MARRQTRDVRLRVDAAVYANAQKLAAFEKIPLNKWFDLRLREIIEKETEKLSESQRVSYDYLPTIGIRDPSMF